jgi:hypothetical protein
MFEQQVFWLSLAIAESVLLSKVVSNDTTKGVSDDEAGDSASEV